MGDTLVQTKKGPNWGHVTHVRGKSLIFMNSPFFTETPRNLRTGSRSGLSLTWFTWASIELIGGDHRAQSQLFLRNHKNRAFGKPCFFLPRCHPLFSSFVGGLMSKTLVFAGGMQTPRFFAVFVKKPFGIAKSPVLAIPNARADQRASLDLIACSQAESPPSPR